MSRVASLLGALSPFSKSKKRKEKALKVKARKERERKNQELGVATPKSKLRPASPVVRSKKHSKSSKPNGPEQQMKQSPPGAMVSQSYAMTPSTERRFRQAVPPEMALLPPLRQEDEGKLTVVLDMDETLLHSEFTNDVEWRQEEFRETAQGEYDFSVRMTDGETAHVYLRPGLREFLAAAAERFEVVVFTAALEEYAKPVLDVLDPNNIFIRHRLYRDSTSTYKGQPFVKDVARLGRNMEKVIIVDNNPYAMLATPDNAVPIVNYYDDPEDVALEAMMACLDVLEDLADVRPYLKHRFRFRTQLQALVASAGMPHLCEAAQDLGEITNLELPAPVTQDPNVPYRGRSTTDDERQQMHMQQQQQQQQQQPQDPDQDDLKPRPGDHAAHNQPRLVLSN